MIKFELNNCNNVTSATIQLKKNHLNIRYAMNGVGKSTVAQAINCIAVNKDVNNNKQISDLVPFGSDLEPTCKPSETINNCMLFDEDFVDTIVFQESEVIQNSFDVFIKTPEYEERQQKINKRLDNIRVAVNKNEDLQTLVTVGRVVLLKFGLTQTGVLRKSGNLKSLMESDSILTLPDALKDYQPMMNRDYKLQWVGWKNEGSTYDDNNICPFCTTALRESYEQEKTIFNTSYKKSNVKNILDTLSYFESVKEYMNESKKEKLYQCIVRTTDEADMLLMIKQFHSELEFLVNKISSIENFNSYQVRSENISKLGEQLEKLIINPSILDIFNNKKVIDLIEFVNTRIQAIKEETDSLKVEIGHLESMIGSSRKAAVKDINDFLVTAGINYRFEITDEAENTSRAILKYISGEKEPIDVANIKNHLSWGEKNAFALVLFMHYALSRNPDIIVLDDPISSFDNNKKYAIINHLFSGQKSFYKKTVLMFTHDLQPIIDYVIVNRPNNDAISPYFLQNISGVMSEIYISDEDIKPLFKLLAENSKNDDLNIIHRIVCLRKLVEHMPSVDDSHYDAYNLLSCLMHGRQKPIFADGTDLTQEQIGSGEELIKQYISDFEYNTYSNNIFTKDYLLVKYSKETNSYFRIQVFRALIDVLGLKPKIDDDTLLKYVNEQFHIENDYIYSLDYTKYDIVPGYFILKCDEFLKKEGIIS